MLNLRRVVAFAKKHIVKTAFAIAFVAGLLKAGEEDRIGKSEVTQIFRQILPDLIPAISLKPVVSNKRAWPDDSMMDPKPEPATPVQVDSEAIAYLLSQCEALGLSTKLEQLYSKLESEASSADGATLDSIILPFLQKFLDTQQPPIHNPRVRSFVHNLILAYVKGYVQMEPTQPTDWRRAAKGCGCADCRQLDNFLVDPVRETGEFSMAEKRRNHLNSKLMSGRHGYGFAYYVNRESEFDISTARVGSPHTLVVRKTDRTWRRVHDEWQVRADKAKERLKTLDGIKVKEVLAEMGKEAYEDLMQLRLVKLAPAVNGAGNRR